MATAAAYVPNRPVPLRRITRPIASRQRRTPPLSGGDLRVFLEVVCALRALRGEGRHAVSIIDCGCGGGGVLLRAARQARALGFLAIEARGFYTGETAVEAASAAFRACRDPAVGLSAALATAAATGVEDGEADILIIPSGAAASHELLRLVDRAGIIIRRS